MTKEQVTRELCLFLGWMTTREEAVTIGPTTEIPILGDLVTEYIAATAVERELREAVEAALKGLAE